MILQALTAYYEQLLAQGMADGIIRYLNPQSA